MLVLLFACPSLRLSVELFNQSQLQHALQADYNVLDERNKILERKLQDAVDTHRLVVTRLQEAITFEHDLMYTYKIQYFYLYLYVIYILIFILILILILFHTGIVYVYLHVNDYAL